MREVPGWIKVPLVVGLCGWLLWRELRAPARAAKESKLVRNARNLTVAAVAGAAVQYAEMPLVPDRSPPGWRREGVRPPQNSWVCRFGWKSRWPFWRSTTRSICGTLSIIACRFFGAFTSPTTRTATWTPRPRLRFHFGEVAHFGGLARGADRFDRRDAAFVFGVADGFDSLHLVPPLEHPPFGSNRTRSRAGAGHAADA